MIKKLVFITTLSMFLCGCNMNPSKEARIQKLEMEIQQSLVKIEALEARVQTLEIENEQLQNRMLVFEEQLDAPDD